MTTRQLDNGVEVSNRSLLSNKLNTMTLDIDLVTLVEWNENRYTENATLIQETFPHLNAVEREFLLSGMSEQEQQQFYEGRQV
jgi:7,8-dihydro-6-hydroxymethylpterin-pyrophosphokinase